MPVKQTSTLPYLINRVAGIASLAEILGEHALAVALRRVCKKIPVNPPLGRLQLGMHVRVTHHGLTGVITRIGGTGKVSIKPDPEFATGASQFRVFLAKNLEVLND